MTLSFEQPTSKKQFCAISHTQTMVSQGISRAGKTSHREAEDESHTTLPRGLITCWNRWNMLRQTKLLDLKFRALHCSILSNTVEWLAHNNLVFISELLRLKSSEDSKVKPILDTIIPGR